MANASDVGNSYCFGMQYELQLAMYADLNHPVPTFISDPWSMRNMPYCMGDHESWDNLGADLKRENQQRGSSRASPKPTETHHE